MPAAPLAVAGAFPALPKIALAHDGSPNLRCAGEPFESLLFMAMEVAPAPSLQVCTMLLMYTRLLVSTQVSGSETARSPQRVLTTASLCR